MMALDSALLILMAEVTAAIVLLAGALIFSARSRRNKEIRAIDNFISQLDEQALLKNQPLDQLLRETCGFDKKTVQDALETISAAERELLQKVVQLFLQRDMSLLNEIDRCIGNLSEPYCQLLSSAAGRKGTAAASPVGNGQSLERINQQLVRQLDTAMHTIDEITSEYTRAFAGNQTGLELENSSKKMLQIFQESINSLKQP